jgi:hypothetical protein
MLFKGRRVATSTLLKLAYLILLATTILYVKSVLDVDSFKAKEKEPARPTKQVVAVTVALETHIDGVVTPYRITMTNTTSVLDLLAELRKTQGLYYEQDTYTYGTELVSVFGRSAPDGSSWVVLAGDQDITHTMATTYLADGATYRLTTRTAAQ